MSEADGRSYVNKEQFEELLWWLQLPAMVDARARGEELIDRLHSIEAETLAVAESVTRANYELRGMIASRSGSAKLAPNGSKGNGSSNEFKSSGGAASVSVLTASAAGVAPTSAKKSSSSRAVDQPAPKRVDAGGRDTAAKGKGVTAAGTKADAVSSQPLREGNGAGAKTGSKATPTKSAAKAPVSVAAASKQVGSAADNDAAKASSKVAVKTPSKTAVKASSKTAERPNRAGSKNGSRRPK